MLTIIQFFNLQTGAGQWISNVKNTEGFNQLKKKLEQELQYLPVPPGFDALFIGEIPRALDIEMSDLFLWAWRKRKEIVQYRDEEKYPPGESHLVPLLEHTIISKHHPTIQPVINHQPLQKIQFDILVKLKLKGAMLKIRDAKIVEILVGSCSGSGSIEYAGLTLLERKTAPYQLPGSISLGKGIPI